MIALLHAVGLFLGLRFVPGGKGHAITVGGGGGGSFPDNATGASEFLIIF